METKTNSQTKARLIVVSVFVIGVAAGALALNLYQQLSRSSDRNTPRSGTEMLLKRMNDKVGLASDQQEQIKKILDETADKYKDIRKEMDPVVKPLEPRFNSVRQETRDRIRALLTAEQLPKYEQMVEEHDKMREQEKERSKK